MSLPWFFDDAAVDHAALDELARAAAAAAMILDDSAHERLRLGAARLLFCAGPFADDLADDLIRRSAEARELAEQCRRLANAAIGAGQAARTEQSRREGLRDSFQAELARDQARARAGADRTSPTGGVPIAAGAAAAVEPIGQPS